MLDAKWIWSNFSLSKICKQSSLWLGNNPIKFSTSNCTIIDQDSRTVQFIGDVNEYPTIIIIMEIPDKLSQQ